MKPGEFVGMLFLARDVTHRVHLSTRSYAKHMALSSFYEGIIPLADKFAEAHQGRHGLMSIPLMPTKTASNVLTFLQTQLSGIEEGRCSICEQSDTALQNIIDEIVGLYLSTIYKLQFLA